MAKVNELKLTATYRYTRPDNSTYVGYLVEGSLDGGDYGFSHVVNICLPDDNILYSVPVSRLKEISREEYCDLVELLYGIEMVS